MPDLLAPLGGSGQAQPLVPAPVPSPPSAATASVRPEEAYFCPGFPHGRFVQGPGWGSIEGHRVLSPWRKPPRPSGNSSKVCQRTSSTPG